MALTAHMVPIDGVGPGPSWRSTLHYVQVVDLGGYLMLRPVYGDGLTVHRASAPTYAVTPPVDISWTTPPECGADEPMGT